MDGLKDARSDFVERTAIEVAIALPAMDGLKVQYNHTLFLLSVDVAIALPAMDGLKETHQRCVDMSHKLMTGRNRPSSNGWAERNPKLTVWLAFSVVAIALPAMDGLKV